MFNNKNHQLLNLFLSINTIIFLTALSHAPISNIESFSIQDRVVQLERISNAHSQLLTNLQQQFSENQADIDSLCGKIQENQYQINLIAERQKKILLQIDRLISRSNNLQEILKKQDDNSFMKHISTGINELVDRNKDEKDYKTAVKIAQNTLNQSRAISFFKNFIKKYPHSIYQSNANYWLGQLNYNKGNKDNAAHYFALVVKNYEESSKAPDAMYKIGLIMQEKGEIIKAKAVYRQVINKYPGTKSAKQARYHLNLMK